MSRHLILSTAAAGLLLLAATIRPPHAVRPRLEPVTAIEARADRDLILYAVDRDPLLARSAAVEGPTLVITLSEGTNVTALNALQAADRKVCTRKGLDGTVACTCQQLCHDLEDGRGAVPYNESEDCPNRCQKECACHVEEECPEPPH